MYREGEGRGGLKRTDTNEGLQNEGIYIYIHIITQLGQENFMLKLQCS